MANKTTVRLDTRRLDALKRELEPRAQAIIDKAAFDVEGDAKNTVPVKTGFLKNSGSTVIGRLLDRVQFTAEYSYFIEFGTRRMSARPYLIPALEKARKPFLAAWKQLVDK